MRDPGGQGGDGRPADEHHQSAAAPAQQHHPHHRFGGATISNPSPLATAHSAVAGSSSSSISSSATLAGARARTTSGSTGAKGRAPFGSGKGTPHASSSEHTFAQPYARAGNHSKSSTRGGKASRQHFARSPFLDPSRHAAVTTTVVTTTTTQVTEFPPILIPPPPATLQPASHYPLLNLPTPPSMKKFTFEIGGIPTRFSEIELPDDLDQLGETPSENVRKVLGAQQERLEALVAGSVDDSEHLQQHRARLAEIGQSSSISTFPQHRPIAQPASGSSRLSENPSRPEDDELTSPRGANLPSPNQSPQRDRDYLMVGPDEGAHSSAPSARSQSPMESAMAIEHGPAYSHLASPGFLGNASSSSGVPSSSQISNLSHASAAAVPAIVNTFEALPTPLKSYLLLHLLRRCPSDTLHFMSTLIMPTLKRDVLGDLPLETAFQIIAWFDIRTLGRCAQVSKKWKSIVDSPGADRTVWKLRLLEEGWYNEEDIRRAEAIARRRRRELGDGRLRDVDEMDEDRRKTKQRRTGPARSDAPMGEWKQFDTRAGRVGSETTSQGGRESRTDWMEECRDDNPTFYGDWRRRHSDVGASGTDGRPLAQPPAPESQPMYGTTAPSSASIRSTPSRRSLQGQDSSFTDPTVPAPPPLLRPQASFSSVSTLNAQGSVLLDEDSINTTGSGQSGSLFGPPPGAPLQSRKGKNPASAAADPIAPHEPASRISSGSGVSAADTSMSGNEASPPKSRQRAHSAATGEPVGLYRSLYKKQYNLRMNWLHGRYSSISFPGHDTHVVTCLQFDDDRIVSG
ncbi:hypothetical protein DFJ73DRAFT_92384 [Zopfochytrium polystomum]|nr:hypothetical protein DFJ73DRAFT_92384 [Zopfochytrium polystomum]